MFKFGKKEETAVGSLPPAVSKYLIDQKWDPDWVSRLRSVTKPNGKGIDIRLFDEREAGQKGKKVKDYASLDQSPDLVLFEGQYDESSNQVQLAKGPGLEIKQSNEVLSESQIWRRIAGLSEPGSTTFFYLGSSPASGGPFGRGATVVERNPDYGKKGKKFNILTVDVEGTEPKGKGQKLWDSDKIKDIVAWIAERHHPEIA